jgi:hypothetical protein
MSATPRPWKTRKGFSSDTIEIFAPNPKIKKPFQPTAIAVVEADTPEGKANAKIIVRAVNCHDDLVALAEACLEWIDAVPKNTVLPAMPGFDRDWGNQVLAKAKGGQSE